MVHEESYAMFTVEDWGAIFIKYLANDTLLQKHEEWYKLKKLATRYFLHEGILFRKRYDKDPLQCLGPGEAKEMLKEVH